MARVVYVPAYPEIPDDDFARLVAALSRTPTRGRRWADDALPFGAACPAVCSLHMRIALLSMALSMACMIGCSEPRVPDPCPETASTRCPCTPAPA